MRILGALTLAAATLLSGASCHRRQAPPDPAAMKQTRWPSCINELMKEGMARCPAPTLALGAEPGRCTAAPAATAPTAIALASLAPEADAVSASPRLQDAEAALGQGDLDRATRDFGAALSAASSAEERMWAHLGLMRVHSRSNRNDEALDDAILARKSAPHTAVTRRAVIYAYARAGNVVSAYDNFRVLSNDGESEDADTLAMMTELADELEATDKLDAAIRLLVATRKADPERACAHSARRTRLGMSTGDRKAIALALTELVRDMQAQQEDGARREACRADTAAILFTLAQRWGQAGAKTLDSVTLDYAAQVHEVLLTNYDQAELDGHGVCVDRRALAHRLADLLFVQKSWAKCGDAYETALQQDPRGERGERAAMAAVTCRQRAWLEDGARLELANDEEKMMSSIQRTDDWRMMLKSFHRYICVARDDAAHVEPVSQAAFARAEAFHEGGAL